MIWDDGYRFVYRPPLAPPFIRPLVFSRTGRRFTLAAQFTERKPVMQITPISGALGAEIAGVDLARELSNSDAAAVHEAFLAHRVLFFRDQKLSPAEFVRFAHLFGEPDIYPFIKGLPEAPEVIDIIKTETDTKNFGGSWHSDTSYMECPALATTLYALEVPEAGGDTLYANTAMAYDALSSGMKELLLGLVGVNSSEKGYQGGRAAGMARLDAMKGTFQAEARTYESEHPVIRTHPETGHKSIYVNRSHTVRFKDMTVEESAPLISYLCEHMIQPEFTCRFQWKPGSLAVWDNRTTLHHAVNDYAGKRRHMRRITIKGDRPC
jgi:taurine dioxygenase